MRIAILAHGATGAGATSVARNLLAAMGRVGPEHTYLVTVPADAGYEEACRQFRSCEVIVLQSRGLLRRWAWEAHALPRMVRRFMPDVVLSLADRALIRPPCPQAVLIHRPQLFYPNEYWRGYPLPARMLFRYHAFHLRRSLPRTQLVLCQTEAAKQRLLARYRIRGRIEICPNAVSTDVGGPAQEVPALPPPLRDTASAFRLLCLCRYYPHKNLEQIVRMLVEHREVLRGVAVVLTIAPEQHPYAARLLRQIRRYRLADQVINVGALPQTELPGFYYHCHALFLPTLLESFSATYVEAMHFERPILTSDMDFAHAVCGDAALYFDPRDTNSMAAAVLRLRDEHGLAHRLVEKGRQRRQELSRSWAEIASDVLHWLADIATDPLRG